LQSNEIADVAPLAGLVNLVKLNLDFNRVLDIAPLAKLTHQRWRRRCK
jgi:Leucine-rich repeat (LRR) protein